MTFRERLARTNFALLISIDQLLQTILVAPFAIAGACSIPDPDETISSVLGQRMAGGNRWAVLPAALVDALFLALTLGRERDHCARAYRKHHGSAKPGDQMETEA